MMCMIIMIITTKAPGGAAGIKNLTKFIPRGIIWIRELYLKRETDGKLRAHR